MSQIASRAAALLAAPLPVAAAGLLPAASLAASALPSGAVPVPVPVPVPSATAAPAQVVADNGAKPATPRTTATAAAASTGGATTPGAATASVPADASSVATANPVAADTPAAAQTAATALNAPTAPTTTTAQLGTPAAFPARPDAGGGIGGAVTALVMVVALILALAWLAKRMPVLGGGAGSNPALRLVGSLALGPRERLVVVAVGDTQLLLGVGAGGTRTLHTLDQPLPVAAASTPAFAQLLAQHFGKKA